MKNRRIHPVTIALMAIAGLGVLLALIFMFGRPVSPVRAQTTATLNLAISSYFGGNGYERAQGITVDNNGYIYIVGNTFSTNLPGVANAFQKKYKGDKCSDSSGDGYVAKFTPDGSTLLWATYLGGTGGDRIYNVAVDSSGFPYVAVWTSSADFPTTPGAFMPTSPTAACVQTHLAYAKLKQDGSGLVWSTYVGGSGTEQQRDSIFVDSAGNVYSSGHTTSPNFPTTANAFQRTLKGYQDAFVLKLAANGASLLYSTLIGGSGGESAVSGVQVASDGSVYIAGNTGSSDFPVTRGALQPTFHGSSVAARQWMGGDGFVARFKPDLSGLIFSTYLGGSDGDEIAVNDGLAIDAAGNAYVTGNTMSTDFPTTSNAFRRTHTSLSGVSGPGPSIDAFVSKISPDGKTLLASTYIGSTGYLDEASGIDVDASGNVYFSGNTAGLDFPVTSDAFQKTLKGGVAGTPDAWLTKMPPDLSSLLYSTYLGSSLGDRGRCLVLDGAGNVFFSGDSDGTDFPTTVGAYDRTFNGGTADSYFVKFVPGSSNGSKRRVVSGKDPGHETKKPPR